MRKSETYKSNFLKADALSTGPGKYRTMIVTVSEISSHEFDDGKRQRVLSFKECEEQLGLNLTNWDTMAEITGKDDDDAWIGAKIELWVDKNVMYGGKKIPAIRIRPVGGFKDDAGDPPSDTGTTLDKKSAWFKFCQRETGCTNEVRAEKWKKAVQVVMDATGRQAPDGFTSEDWHAVLDGPKAMAGMTSDDIPFNHGHARWDC